MRAYARLRRPALALLFPAAAVLAIADELPRFGSSFLATGLPGHGQAAVGDHLQTSWWFWLVGHQLEQGRAPWIDPYSFQPLVEPQVVFGGWPFGLPYWPLHAALGAVLAWNVLLLLVTAACGAATYGWLRALDLPVAAAVVGGLAFELAPYRLAQSGVHLLGWVALFIPLALLGIERARLSAGRRAHAWGALAAVSVASVPLSGQVHLALGTIPFALAYAVVRFRPLALAWTAGGALAGIAAGLLVNTTVIAGSTGSGGRTLAEVEAWQASWIDFVDRWRERGLEDFVYVGWLMPVLALAGLVVLARRRPWLAAVLGLAAVVPLLLALGTNTPVYEALRAVFPPLRYPRVPGRLVPVADLALAGLAAVAVAAGLRLLAHRSRTAAAAAVAAVALVAADLTVWPLHATAADPENGAYAALGPGRILELPVVESAFGSPYLYYATQEPRERPGGYAAARPREQAAFNARWRRLNCGVWRPGDEGALRRLGIVAILVHGGLFEFTGRGEEALALDGLRANGWRLARRDGRVALYVRGGERDPQADTTTAGACVP